VAAAEGVGDLELYFISGRIMPAHWGGTVPYPAASFAGINIAAPAEIDKDRAEQQ